MFLSACLSICLTLFTFCCLSEERGCLWWRGSPADPAASIIQSWLCNPLELQKRNLNTPGDCEVSTQRFTVEPFFFFYWCYRWIMVLFLAVLCRDEDEVQKVYEAELSFIESCLKVNPKSYGSWHHRGWVSARLPRPDWARELSLCDRCLSLDDRNCKKMGLKNNVSTPCSSWHYVYPFELAHSLLCL